MAEIKIEKRINWKETLLTFVVGETKVFDKKYFGKLQAVRQAASNLSAIGKWAVTANSEETTFSVTREA